MSACIDLVRREIADLSEKELDDVLEQMRERQNRLVRDGMDPGIASAQAGREIADTLKAAAAIERRNSALNRKIRIEALDYIQTTWNDDPAEGIFALLYGSPKARFGSRASANAAQDANFRKYTAGVAGELEAAGLFDVLRRGEMDRDVARAMWSVGDEAALRKLPEQAVAIAKTLQKWQEVARLDGNRAGAWTGKLDNYVVRQSHSPDRIAKAGEASWKEKILPRLDLAKMFPDGVPKDLDEWMHETFLNLTTGVRPKGTADFTAERMSAFKGPGNLAKRLSQERVFHFRSADDWFDYNTEFGFGNLREAYVQGLHRAAESTGLMQVLGTNPEFNLDSVVTSLRAKLSRTDPKALAKFDAKTRRGTHIENALKEVSGFTRQVASQRLATIGSSIRVWNTLTGLGGAVVSAITDIPIRASALKYQGQSYLGSLGKGVIAPLKRIVGAVGDSERKATLAAVGYFNEMAMGNLAVRFSPDESIPGRLQRATHTFFKWNLLGGWTDEMRRTSLESMGRFFGEAGDSEFAALSERTQRTLERFRIGEREWGVIRKGIREESGGEKFLTPTAIREVPRESFADLAADRINALKVGLVERLKRRASADQREAEWRIKRSEKLREDLARANVRLSERIANAEGKSSAELRDLQEKLAGLYDHLDASQSYWDNVRETRPSIGEIHRNGAKQARAQAAAAEARALHKRITRDLEAVRDELDTTFVEKWLGKENALERRLARMDDAEGSAAQEEFAQLFTEANAQLTGRVEKLEGAAAAKVRDVIERLGNAEAQIAESADLLKLWRDSRPKVSILRDSGVSEGRALESAKNLKAEAREIGRDLARLKKELNEDFIERWTDRQDDLVAFAERSEQRLNERAAASEKDISNLEPQINRILDEVREDMANRVQQLYADEVNSAVISPDARTLALVRQGQQAGTPMGEALRLFWQFKTFGIAVIQRAFLREFYGYGKGAGGRLGTSEIRGLATLMLGSTAFGYAAMSAKDMLKGRSPRPVDETKTWQAAMIQGGGMGIYGDFLFGQSNRFGQGFLTTLGGPTVGKGEEMFKLWNSFKSGEDVAAKAVKFGISNTPYANLFYTRMAADYLFLYELQEAMNPGYLRRMEQSVESETGSEWWLRPSEAVN
jgi:hypothetical protein